MLLIKAKAGLSLVHGLGLFAEELIPVGTKIWEFTPGLDLEITPADFAALPQAAKEYIDFHGFLSKRTGNYHLSFDDIRFTNHSSDQPNIATVAESDDVELPLVAIRDIQPGEEILQDYDDFDSVSRF